MTLGYKQGVTLGYLSNFLKKSPLGQKNPEKAEFFLPFVVNDLLAQGKAQVTVLSSADKWYGVTYKEDKEKVVDAIRTMAERGQYPSPLWQ